MITFFMWYAEDVNLSSSLNSNPSFLAPIINLSCPKMFFLEHSNFKFLIKKKKGRKSKHSMIKSFSITLYTISPCYFIKHKY